MNWGRGLSGLRKVLIQADQDFSDEIQSQLNLLKNVSNTIYNIHKEKYNKIVPIKEELKEQTKYVNLCGLAESDYVKYALEIATKK